MPEHLLAMLMIELSVVMTVRRTELVAACLAVDHVHVAQWYMADDQVAQLEVAQSEVAQSDTTEVEVDLWELLGKYNQLYLLHAAGHPAVDTADALAELAVLLFVAVVGG